MLSRFSRAWLFVTSWSVACQPPPPLGFSRQEHWSGLPFPLQCTKVKTESEVAQSCPTLRDPMDCSLPGPTLPWDFPGKSPGVGHQCLLPGGTSGKESNCRCRRHQKQRNYILVNISKWSRPNGGSKKSLYLYMGFTVFKCFHIYYIKRLPVLNIDGN